MHPTDVDERTLVRMKQKRARGSEGYFFAFSKSSYCDLDINNKTEKSTTSCPEFREGMKQLIHGDRKPVVFFTCYDIGYKKQYKTFIRHVVLCIANRIGDTVEVFMFDMRNLREIDNHHRSFIENEISKEIHLPEGMTVSLTNMACIERKSCIHLQRFRASDDPGWCVAWALFFTDFAVLSPILNGKKACELSAPDQKRGFAEIYRNVDNALKVNKNNDIIQDWFAEVLKSQ